MFISTRIPSFRNPPSETLPLIVPWTNSESKRLSGWNRPLVCFAGKYTNGVRPGCYFKSSTALFTCTHTMSISIKLASGETHIDDVVQLLIFIIHTKLAAPTVPSISINQRSNFPLLQTKKENKKTKRILLMMQEVMYMSSVSYAVCKRISSFGILNTLKVSNMRGKISNIFY